MDDQPPKTDSRARNARAASEAVKAHLKAERVRAGLNQEDLAELSGLTAQIISRIELGQRKMTLDEIFLLAEALGMSGGEFIDGAQDAMRKRLPKKTASEDG